MTRLPEMRHDGSPFRLAIDALFHTILGNTLDVWNNELQFALEAVVDAHEDALRAASSGKRMYDPATHRAVRIDELRNVGQNIRDAEKLVSDGWALKVIVAFREAIRGWLSGSPSSVEPQVERISVERDDVEQLESWTGAIAFRHVGDHTYANMRGIINRWLAPPKGGR